VKDNYQYSPRKLNYINKKDVCKIKQLLLEGVKTEQEIAQMFNTESYNINNIKLEKTYKNIMPKLHIKANLVRKLRKEDIPVIKKMYADGTMQKDIAKVYGVANNTISQAISGKNWRESK